MIDCPPHGSDPGYRESAEPPKQPEWCDVLSDGELRAFVPASQNELDNWRRHVAAFLTSNRVPPQRSAVSQWAALTAAALIIYERRLRARMEPK
jgi:hypothetical protein